jgi:glutamate-1-semialdehyde 2,1-aminomutase
MVPSAERVRFGSSGTEVIQAALRLARAATGRSKIVKFEGHYHGWLDNVLWSVAPTPDRMGAESGPTPLPGTAGQDAPAGSHIEVLSWNRVDDVAARLERGDVAAVIMEAAMCNSGAIRPAPGYLETVRELCIRTGTVLMFDEVITGFRVGPGGVQKVLGVTPDLSVFGKAIANGFPVAALVGRADLMDRFGTGEVMHGGTYNAGAVAMAATVATLKSLREPGFYDRLGTTGRRLMDGIRGALDNAGVPATVTGFPEIFHVGMGLTSPPVNYRDIMKVDRPRYVKLTTGLLGRGVRALERGAWFSSITHTDAIIDETIETVRQVARTI